MNARKLKVEIQRKIAVERVERLFSLAESSGQKLADRYVALARKIASKVNLRLPIRIKRKFCKDCGCYLRPGVNCRVRTRNGKLVYQCLNCKKISRMPFNKEKNKK